MNCVRRADVSRILEEIRENSEKIPKSSGFSSQNFYFFCFCFSNRGDTIQYHGGLRSWELGQAPMLLVFPSPRQALSSHLHVFIMILWESMNFHPD